MDKKYFVVVGTEQKGPYSIEDLKNLNVKKTDLIWYDGIEDWIKAGDLEELQSFFVIDLTKKENLKEEETQNSQINLVKVEEKPQENLPIYLGEGERVTQRIGNIEYLGNNTLRYIDNHEIIYYRYANFGERLLARIIDTLIVCIPAFIVPIAGPWLYFALQYSGQTQRTIGQSSMRIQLLSTDGTKISFGQGTGRFFAILLNAFTFFIGYIMFFFNSKSQCLHDLLANTIVVSEFKRELR